MKIKAHESFYIRRGWLSKGIKNINNYNRLFNDKNINSCDVLGIGTNMVKSLRYWLNATCLMVEIKEKNYKIQKSTALAKLISKYDPYHEEIGTLIILHYKLATNEEFATSWYWLFNEFDGSIFDKEIFINGMKAYIVSKNEKIPKGISDDYNCLLKTYINKEIIIDPEENKVCPLSELNILEYQEKNKEIKKKELDIQDIHPLIAYSIIMDKYPDQEEIKIDNLYNKENLAKIFNLSRLSLMQLLNKIEKMEYIKIVRTAGLNLIKIKKSLSFLECLEFYYIMLNGENHE